MDKEKVMVTIQCNTYNHELYIRQCLDGFVMQKTNFRYIAIVHDDASTDGTASIIREYEEEKSKAYIAKLESIISELTNELEIKGGSMNDEKIKAEGPNS